MKRQPGPVPRDDVLAPHKGPWTWDDLLALPEDDARRYEVVDGALLIMPPTGKPHWWVEARLLRVLAAVLPEELEVGPAGGLVTGPSSYRIPDVLVIRRDALLRGVRDAPRAPFEPGAVVLAVEVESPGSRTNDRVVKPREYAAAGVEHYWRVVPDDGPLLEVHRLDPGTGAYDVVGRWQGDEEAVLQEPFPVRLRPSDLLG